MKQVILTFSWLFFGLNLWSQDSLESKLFDMCGVRFEKIATANGFEASYKLMIRQDLDHKHPEKGHFYQKVYLNHRSFEAPTVLITEGYNRNTNRIYELSDFLEANQVTVEHRFFGESLPDSLEYNYLNFYQETADLHHVNELMKTIYKDDFIASGISKGGTTTIFYRYFYPDDVDVSIPYVAPLNHELEEKRIYEFLDSVGTQECRDRVFAFQKRLLKNRDYNIDRLGWYAKGAGLEFTYLTLATAFEYAVLEYPFSLWQWGTDCSDVPDFVSDKDDLDHLIKVSGIDFFSDRSMTDFASHYYQSGTEMGYYGYQTAKFKGLLKELPTDHNASAVFMPNKMEASWNADLTKKVADWVKRNGNEFIFINGLNDTWSATRVPVYNNLDALWFNMAGQSHGTARIANMTDDEKTRLKAKVQEWLER